MVSVFLFHRDLRLIDNTALHAAFESGDKIIPVFIFPPEQIDPDKKLEMIEHLNSVMTYSDFEGDFVDAKFEDLIELSELERVNEGGTQAFILLGAN